MKKFVFAVMAGALLWSAPALSQSRTFLDTIQKDRHYDTVEDLIEKAGCHHDWQELASWDQPNVKKRNWLRRLFSGKPKLPVGTKIYLDVSSLKDCKLSPKEYAKAETMGKVVANTLTGRVELPAPISPRPATRPSGRAGVPQAKRPRPIPQDNSALNAEKKKVKELEEKLGVEKQKTKTLEENLAKGPPPVNHENWHYMLFAMGVGIGLSLAIFTFLFWPKNSREKAPQQKVTVSPETRLES